MTTSGPNVKDTPRSFSFHPVISLSGSDQSRSLSRPIQRYPWLATLTFSLNLNLRSYAGTVPVSGTSVGRIMRRICSMLCKSGERPPCMQKIFSSMMAATGKQLKQSVNVFHNLILYRLLPSARCKFSVHWKNGWKRTFIVKSIDAVDACRFVVTAQDEEVFRVLDFVGQ